MTGSNDKDSLDTFFREAFEQLPDTPSTSGWDKPSDAVWSRIQMDVAKASPPPQSRFGRLWFVGAAALVTVLALFWYTQQSDAIEQAIQNTPAVEQTAEVHFSEEIAKTETPIFSEKKQTAERVLEKTSQAQKMPMQATSAANIVEKNEQVELNPEAKYTISETPEVFLDETPEVEVPNTLEKLSLQSTDNQNLTPEVKPQQRFPNNLDRIKAKRNEEGQTARSVSPLQPLPQKPIPNVHPLHERTKE